MKNNDTPTSHAPRFTVLSDTQIGDLHHAALEVLRHTGVRFDYPITRSLAQ